jgi:hemolysin activation/secretion protein
MRILRAITLLLAGAATGLIAVGQAWAQSAVERNLPATVAPRPAALSVGETDYGKGDDKPLGVNLAGVRLIGPDEKVAASAPAGISLGNISGITEEAARAALSPYIGKPLTRAQITRMQAALAGLWRKAGFPFMSVTVPPQEITSGVLSLRIIEFHAGAVKVEGGSALERNLAGRMRVEPGQRIDAAAIKEDLDWINRNPFRRVEGVFAPGDGTGASDITLKVTQDKPFQVFGSYANTGSEATGMDRWSFGGGLWLPALNDMTLSYRFTRSGEFWDNGDVFKLDTARGGYISHSGRIDLPTFDRQALSIAPNFVETNELVTGTPFSFDNTTFELPILYRSAISNILPGRYWGDLYFGVEPKWLKRTTAFAGVNVAQGEANLFNLVLGWSDDFSDRYGTTSVDARIKGNPGGVLSKNTAADWAAFTGGRVDDNTYVTAGIDISRMTDLTHGFGWATQLSGLIAGQALPDSERLSLGGYYAVRGYGSEDGAADAGLVWRNELRLPSYAPLAGAGLGIRDGLSPFLFADLGHGYDFAAKDHMTLASTGAGFDYSIGSNLAASLTGAIALAHAGETRSGDATLTASVRVSY